MGEMTLDELASPAVTKPIQALRQVALLCGKGLSLHLRPGPDGRSFQLPKKKGDQAQGALSASVVLSDPDVIEVEVELARGNRQMRGPYLHLFEGLAGFGGKVRLGPPRENEDGTFSLLVGFRVKAVPLAVARSTAFLKQVQKVEDLAKEIQEGMPVQEADQVLQVRYAGLEELLEPILPLQESQAAVVPQLDDWAQECADLLRASANMVVVSPSTATVDFALSLISRACGEVGTTLGHLLVPAINGKVLIDLANLAPGVVVVPAVRMTLGANPYELGREMTATLAALASAGKPVLFTGSLEQLQATFSSQGMSTDPLLPVVRHVPKIPLEALTRFAIHTQGGGEGGIPPATEERLVEEVLESINEIAPEQRPSVLPLLAGRAVKGWASGETPDANTSARFASRLGGLSETLGGLSPRPRGARRPEVQERLTRGLTGPGLLEHFEQHLLGQGKALRDLTSRLAMEALTRPLHQPIRYCAQSTPGTGKSESAVLLARWLEIPYVNIDAASMPDHQMAASQLLGSGRGFVNSHRAGRLEEVGKSHLGAVVEVSDLDHASANVRSFLADLFLQSLETGEAQSATGSMFSLANVIFAFTMNLPGGADERVRKGLGFQGAPTEREIRRRVEGEIKAMLSSAFLSRIGTPILFDPLDEGSLAAILERAILAAVRSGAQRLGVEAVEIVLEGELGGKVLASLEASVLTFGARALLEHGRTLAAAAVERFAREQGDERGGRLEVSALTDGELCITSSGGG